MSSWKRWQSLIITNIFGCGSGEGGVRGRGQGEGEEEEQEQGVQLQVHRAREGGKAA